MINIMQAMKIFLDKIIFPYRGAIAKRASRYFFKYHVVEILKETNGWFEIGEYQKPIDLVDRPAFRGLINEYIRSNRYCPSPKDIAVAINIAVHGYGKGKDEYKTSIINLSYHIVSSIQERISFDPVLKLTFENLGKKMSDIDTHQDRSSIEEVFKSKKSIFSHYFNSFSDSRYSYPLRIWHQADDKTWIEWTEEDSIIVDVNPVRIREGFFLLGFDYHDMHADRSLGVAVSVDGYEYFNRHRDDGKAVWIN